MKALFVRRRRCRGESGVSLIELLIAISITGIILAPIGAAIYFGFRTTGETQRQVAESSSANVMASYFTADVQGAIAAAKSTSDAVSCGAAAGAADLVLTTVASPTTTVSYYRGSGANASVLYRRTCANGVLTGLTRVASSLSATPDFACSINGTPVADCSTFRSITASMLQQSATGQSPYQTVVTATKRGN
jgi:prepilin-type N-terminal cleavage/methylation domain-containing protein